MDLSGVLCFGLDSGQQQRSGFCYGYPACQVGYSRNLLFRSGAQLEDLFDRIVDRARSRPASRQVRTLSGVNTQPHRGRAGRGTRWPYDL